MRTRIRLLGLFTVTALTMSACGSGGSGSHQLTIWDAYAGQQDKVDFIKWAMKEFKKENPKITVKEVSAEQSSYKTKLNTAMASGNPPDVFYTLPGGYLGAFVDGNQVYPLDAELAKDGWKDSFLPSALKSVRKNGRTYGVPIDIDSSLIWYNKKLFAAHGWTAPHTWDEFLALCEQIKAAGIVPLALGNKDSWPATFWFQYSELRLRGAGVLDKYVAKAPDATLGPEGTQSFATVQQLAQKGYFPKGFNGMADQDANMLFLNGKAAMVLNGTWQIGASADAPGSFELGYFPYPTVSGGKGDPSDVIAGVAAAFAVSQKAHDKADAVTFLRFLTSPKVMTKYVEMRKTMVTVKGATTAQAAGPLLYDITQHVVTPAKDLDAFYDTAMQPQATQTYYTLLQGVLDGKTAPADAAQRLETALKSGK